MVPLHDYHEFLPSSATSESKNLESELVLYLPVDVYIPSVDLAIFITQPSNYFYQNKKMFTQIQKSSKNTPSSMMQITTKWVEYWPELETKEQLKQKIDKVL